MDREYIVTLHRKEDLEQFYNEMKLSNFPLVMKRPMSRNTHYMMTEDQAERLRLDPRVWDVEAVENISKVKRNAIPHDPYVVSGQFFKDSSAASAGVDPGMYQWGLLHCAGDDAQRRKTAWGTPTTTEVVTDTFEVYNSGRHVDVVIVDDPISFDSEEWYSPTTGSSRFVQYQWFTELNTLVNSIDDDFQSEPTGAIVYGDNASTPQYHGNHVCGTVAGQHYGWAREANIYNLAVTDPWPSGQSVGALLIFDYLRAFHRNKPVNPDTGIKNPTITNHSYSGIRSMDTPTETLQFTDLVEVYWRGTIYDAGNPGPSGWSQAGVEADFGVRFGLADYPSYSSSVRADVEDAIEEGIVIVGSAGNDNLLVASPNDQDWNNYITVAGSTGSLYYNRGGWPNTPDAGGIIVGALQDHADFRRSTYTMFGPGVTVFAPGDVILSAYGNTGFNDTKYTQGSGNYYQGISGTSMASPQVAGVLACQATGKERFSNYDAKRYVNNTSRQGDMTFDVAGGGLNDNSCRQNSPNSYLIMKNPKPEVGYSFSQIGDRKTGLTYPRASVFNRPSPTLSVPVFPTRTYNFNVGNSGASHYTISGVDSQQGIFPAENDPTIYAHVGDTLEFAVNASGHPFYIKTSPTTGTGNQVTTGTVTGQGVSSGTATWDTTGVNPGTYYYICQFHGGMVGQIVISNPPAQPTYSSVLGNWLSSSIITSVGIDRNGYIQNTIGANFNFNQGDIIRFELNSLSGHPIWIKTSSTPGTADAVTTGVITNNGSDSGVITWDTTGVQPGTYHYQCEVHDSMDGTITIS